MSTNHWKAENIGQEQRGRPANRPCDSDYGGVGSQSGNGLYATEGVCWVLQGLRAIDPDVHLFRGVGRGFHKYVQFANYARKLHREADDARIDSSRADQIPVPSSRAAVRSIFPLTPQSIWCVPAHGGSIRRSGRLAAASCRCSTAASGVSRPPDAGSFISVFSARASTTPRRECS